MLTKCLIPKGWCHVPPGQSFDDSCGFFYGDITWQRLKPTKTLIQLKNIFQPKIVPMPVDIGTCREELQ